MIRHLISCVLVCAVMFLASSTIQASRDGIFNGECDKPVTKSDRVHMMEMLVKSTANAAGEKEETSPANNNDGSQGKGREILFRFLVVPGKTGALIDSVRIINKKKTLIADLDVGSDKDTKVDNHLCLNEENQWGSARVVDGCSARPVNDNNGKSEHSQFVLHLAELPKDGGLRIIIRYKDIGEDLLPIEIFDGEEFRRIAQILLENRGEWIVEEFRIPKIEIK